MSAIRRWTVAAAAALGASLGGAAAAQEGARPNDYAEPANWLCRPDTGDVCDMDVSATVVPAGDEALTVEPFTADPDAPIDCFYVYPTVSRDPAGNSDMVPDAGEIDVAIHHMARFSSVCKVYAPIYRQVTLAVLRGAVPEGAAPVDRALAYADVRDAWLSYLERDNQGRGVVLVGHSQGASLLVRLIAEEIDGRSPSERLVSALLLGSTVRVPSGALAGGTFAHIPLCTSPDETGCVISYASYRDTIPPPENALFGRNTDDGAAACVNPAALDGSDGALDAYFGTYETAFNVSSAMPGPWTSAGWIDTPFVRTPGLLSGECVDEGGFSYLRISVHPDPADPRTDEIVGDVVRNGEVLPDWGFHLIDMNAAQGNLIRIVERQGAAYLTR